MVSLVGSVPSEQQRAGDPDRGYAYLVNGAVSATCLLLTPAIMHSGNVILLFVVVGVAYWWIANALNAYTGWRPPVIIRNSRAVTVVMLSLALAFTVARNTPMFRALAP